MPLPDIRAAGVLAKINLWGWPYHGICSGGAITLPDSSTKAMTQPSHGAAWLYDMGLPAIVRTPAQLLEDAALGHQWLNYAFISGGMVYGTALGDNRFIYVDPDGVRWLIAMTFSTPEISLQKVRLTFTVERFGLLRENGAGTTLVGNVIDVTCSHISYSSFAGANYTATQVYLDDVWTNGSKALLGVYRTDGSAYDMYSLIEASFSGVGGTDGSGVVVAAVEIRGDSELTYATSVATPFNPVVSASFPISDTGTDCSRVVTWGVYPGVMWDDVSGMVGTIDALDTERDITSSFARMAYYDSSGVPHVYRLTSGYTQRYSFAGTSNTGGGSETWGGAFCDEGASDAHAYSFSSIFLEINYGLYLMRDDVEIDAVKFSQSADGAQWFLHGFAHLGATYSGPTTLPATPSGYIDTGAFSGGGSADSRQIMQFTAPVMTGSLASALSITPPAFTGTQSFSYLAPPLGEAAMLSIYNAWRAGTRHYSSGSAVIGGSDSVGIQRIDSKAVGFYLLSGGVRTYGDIHTPVGVLSAGLTPASNLWFAWNRKTGATSLSIDPICYV